MTKPPAIVLLIGPPAGVRQSFYGGGIGGYLRNFQVYLQYFSCPRYQMRAGVVSSRKLRSIPGLSHGWRFLKDSVNFMRCVRGVQIVHVLGRYDQATVLEYFMLRICQWRGVRYVYEVKGGHLCAWLQNGPPWLRKLFGVILREADAVLCEGQMAVELIERTYGSRALFFPNYVPQVEVPAVAPPLFPSPTLRVLFTGYCFPPKGVHELAEAVALVQAGGQRVELTLVGQEHPETKAFLNQLQARYPALRLHRLGVCPHDEVLRQLAQADVFGFPTKHPGEGHSNAINEAMMMGRVIISTRKGYLGDVLNDDLAYLVPEGSVTAIVEALRRIADHPEEARAKADRARAALLAHYTSDVLYPQLVAVYDRCLGLPPEPAAPAP